MSGILVKGATLVTMDENRPDSFTGDILVRGNLVEDISECPARLEIKPGDRVIEGKNLIVMPGLVNTHGHAAMTLLRSYTDDLPLNKWLEEIIWPIEKNLEGDDVYWGSMLAAAEMIRGGTTTFTDMYFFVERVAEAVRDSGIRAVLSRAIFGFDGMGSEILRESEELVNSLHGSVDGRVNITLGPHAPYTCPPVFMKEVISLAEKTGRPLQIHLSETRGEVEESMRIHGCSPVELLNRLGLLEFKVIAAHCVHVSENDMDILAEKGVGVSHNPGSNLKLGSGIARISAMLGRGIRVGIGTDGASSNNNLDMIEEMRLAALLEKGIFQDPTLNDARITLRMATRYGAEILGLEKTGILRKGYRADLIGLCCNRPHLTPMHDPLANIVYSSGAADVELTMVDGNILLENGSFTALDEEKIRAEASSRAKRLIKASGVRKHS